MNFLGMGPMELLLIMVVALMVFGPDKLPQIMGQVGKAVADFRRTTTELSGEFNRALQSELAETRAVLEETKAAVAEMQATVNSTVAQADPNQLAAPPPPRQVAEPTAQPLAEGGEAEPVAYAPNGVAGPAEVTAATLPDQEASPPAAGEPHVQDEQSGATMASAEGPGGREAGGAQVHAGRPGITTAASEISPPPVDTGAWHWEEAAPAAAGADTEATQPLETAATQPIAVRKRDGAGSQDDLLPPY